MGDEGLGEIHVVRMVQIDRTVSSGGYHSEHDGVHADLIKEVEERTE